MLHVAVYWGYEIVLRVEILGIMLEASMAE